MRRRLLWAGLVLLLVNAGYVGALYFGGDDTWAWLTAIFLIAFFANLIAEYLS